MLFRIGDRVEFWSIRAGETYDRGTGILGTVDFVFLDGLLVVSTDAVGQLVCGPETHRIELADAEHCATAGN